MDPNQLKAAAISDLSKINSAESLEEWRIKYLGRKGELSKIFQSFAQKSLEEKKQLGPTLNNLKRDLENLFHSKSASLKAASHKSKVNFDITQPGKKIDVGHLHPLTLVENQIRSIFSNLNFSIVEGPELETEHYNFDALNMPANHPARDMQDTLWVNRSKGLLMRTHTSAVQIRYMENHQPPIQIIVPGRVFRHEAIDFSHETNFYQFEGLMVASHQNISLANFKFIAEEFFKEFFQKQVPVRFRHSYFPFVEPGIEVDIRLGNNWLEVMGAGMVHPKVFEAVHYPSTGSKRVRGFAFGGSVERLAMIKYGIPDIRLFYSSDLRFIKQF